MQSLSKRSLLTLDFSIFATELGAFLTWLATITLVGSGANSAQIIAGFWIANRIQRVIFGGLVGSYVDSYSNKIKLLIISILLYLMSLVILLAFGDTSSTITLLAITFILPVFRQCASLSRIVYVKNAISGEELSKQIKLLEILPLVASGVSALIILFFSDKISLRQFIQLDLVLHTVALLILVQNREWPESVSKSISQKFEWNFRKEWLDLREIFADSRINQRVYELYLLVLAFGSYPVLVNILSTSSSGLTRNIYAAYSVGLAVGSFVALVINQTQVKPLSFPFLRAAAGLAVFLQLIGIVDFGMKPEWRLITICIVGIAVTTSFVLYLATIRADLVSNIESKNLASWLSTIARIEFLMATLMAYFVGAFAANQSLSFVAWVMIFLMCVLIIFTWSRRLIVLSAAILVLVCISISLLNSAPRRIVSADEGDGTYRIAYAYRIKNLDPYQHTNYSKHIVARQLYDTLVGFNSQLKLEPRIAESWSIDEKQKSMTFVIKANARFSDGTEITSSDIRDSLLNPGNDVNKLFGFNFRIYIVSSKEIKLFSSLPPELLLRRLSLIRASITRPLQNGYLASGPYKLDRFDLESGTIQIVKNSNYHTVGVRQDQIEFKFYEPEDAIKAFEDSKIDEIDTGNYPSIYSWAQTNTTKYTSFDIFLPMTDFIVFNARSDLFKTAAKRLSFQEIWQRTGVSAVFWHTAAPLRGITPFGIPGYGARLISTSMDKKVSFSRPINIGTLIKDRGEKVEAYFNNFTKRKGIKLNIRMVYFDSTDELIEQLKLGKLDARILSNTPKDYDARSLLATFQFGAEDNVYGINDLAINNLFSSSLAFSSEATDTILKIDQRILDQGYAFPLAYRRSIKAVKQSCPDYICDSSLIVWDRRLFK